MLGKIFANITFAKLLYFLLESLQIIVDIEVRTRYVPYVDITVRYADCVSICLKVLELYIDVYEFAPIHSPMPFR